MAQRVAQLGRLVANYGDSGRIGIGVNRDATIADIHAQLRHARAALEHAEAALADLTRTDKPEPLLVSVEQAAALLGIGRTSAWSLVRQGRLPVVRIGRSTKIRLADIRNYAA